MPTSTNSQLDKLDDLFSCIVPSQFYPNQTSAAKEILDNFASDTRYVMLSAQMQSGKTGCAFYVMFEMLISEKIDKVFIMSGSSDTALREQWREKYPKHLANFCQARGWTYRKDKKRVEEIGKKIENGIVWRQDILKKSDLFTDKYLIIWDESHFAVTENQTLHKFYEKVGLLSCIQGDTSYLKTQNAYILSITATRCAEQARFVGANDGVEVDDWKMVVMHPGDKYRGVQEIKTKGLLHPSVQICERNEDKLRAIFGKYSHQKKYFILRTGVHKKDVIVSKLAEVMGIPIIRYNADTKKDINVNVLKGEPDQFTLFLIKGMLRMGKELPKEYVTAVYECAGQSKTNTTLQGLVGRTCGYYTDDIEDVEIDMYIPDGPENDAVNQYIESVESGFKKGLVNTALVPNQVRDREWYPNVPMHIQASELTESFGLNATVPEMKSKPSAVCLDLKKFFDERYDKSNMTTAQIIEINEALQQGIDGDDTYDPEDGNIEIEQTNKQSKKELPKMDEAIEQGDPSVMGYNTDTWIDRHIKIIKVTTNVGFEGTRFRKGDLVVNFNTREQSKFECHMHPKCNGKSVFITTKEAEVKTLGPDDDGVSKCHLPEGIKHDVTLFKKSLRELITDYLDDTRVVKQASGCGTGRVAFSKDVYKHKGFMEGILRSIEKEFDGKIKICTEAIRGRPAVGEEGCVRVKRIYWHRVAAVPAPATKPVPAPATKPVPAPRKNISKKQLYPESELEEIEVEVEKDGVSLGEFMLHEESGDVFEKSNLLEPVGKVDDGEISWF
jgi:hypothetical protein